MRKLDGRNGIKKTGSVKRQYSEEAHTEQGGDTKKNKKRSKRNTRELPSGSSVSKKKRSREGVK